MKFTVRLPDLPVRRMRSFPGSEVSPAAVSAAIGSGALIHANRVGGVFDA